MTDKIPEREKFYGGPEGIITALATPYDEEGQIDIPAMRRLAQRLVESGIDGIFICGTTGEGALLSAEEKSVVASELLDVCGGVPIIAAVIQPDTSNSLRELKQYTAVGIQYIAVVSPYYIRVDEEELVEHFMTIAESSPVPVIVYDIPGNTANPLTDRVYDAILGHQNIVAVKDSSGNFSRFSRRVIASDGTVNWIQGEDTLDAPALLAGASGIVSGLSNVFPEPFVQMVKAHRRADSRTVLAMQAVVNRLHAIVRSTGKGVAAIRLALSLQDFGSRYLKSRGLSLSSQWDEQIKTDVTAAKELYRSAQQKID